jgi:hypothetical protein
LCLESERASDSGQEEESGSGSGSERSGSGSESGSKSGSGSGSDSGSDSGSKSSGSDSNSNSGSDSDGSGKKKKGKDKKGKDKKGKGKEHAIDEMEETTFKPAGVYFEVLSAIKSVLFDMDDVTRSVDKVHAWYAAPKKLPSPRQKSYSPPRNYYPPTDNDQILFGGHNLKGVLKKSASSFHPADQHQD